MCQDRNIGKVKNKPTDTHCLHCLQKKAPVPLLALQQMLIFLLKYRKITNMIIKYKKEESQLHY